MMTDRELLIKQRWQHLKATKNGHHRGRPPKGLTQYTALLDAIKSLPQPFTISQLIVRAWQEHRSLFGLPGFEWEHPCSRRVLAAFHGDRGAVKLGLVRKVGDGQWEVCE